MTRRKHHKVTTFPPEIVEEINKRLVEGHTYATIIDWLKHMGHPLGTTSLHRYSKDFLNRMERLRVIKEQAKAIVNESGETPGTEMVEAASQLALEMIISKLQKARDLDEVDISDILKAIPRYEHSATRRETLKMQFTKGVDAAMNKLKNKLKEEVAADPALQARLFTLIDKSREECFE